MTDRMFTDAPEAEAAAVDIDTVVEGDATAAEAAASETEAIDASNADDREAKKPSGDRSVYRGNDWLCVTLVLLSCIVGTLLVRIISYFSPGYSTYGGYLLSQAAFSLPVQLLFFLAVPFAIYKVAGGRSVGETLRFSSVSRFEPWFLLALPLGAAVFVATVGVSSGWTGLLRLTGYTPSSSSPDLPERFVPGYFVAEVVMTAALPAVCEEFAMRGGLLTTVRRSYGKLACVLYCSVMFGLFHQNIRQVFYTALFGGLAAFLVCETESIFPAVIMHFTNNFCSVYFDYAASYGWLGGGLFGGLSSVPGGVFLAVVLAAIAVAAGIVFAVLYFRNSRNMRVGKSRMSMDEAVVKPRSVEIAGNVALASVALLTTVFTYVWGFLY